jgi:hypothetical protein
MVEAIRGKLGIDGPVAYTFLARFTNILGSTGTVLLIVRFLSPDEQGYYYTLLSLVSLQLVFEMGFSFVIQQLAAHECVHLSFDSEGMIGGNSLAYARLASALQLGLRWYSIAAAAMALVVAPLGLAFFERHSAVASAQVFWRGPWLTAIFASAAGLWATPFYSFLEGCGQIRAVAAMRFRQSIAAAVFAWVTMLLHCGLYAPALVIIGQTAMGLLFIAGNGRLLLNLLRYPSGRHAIHWTREIWPFQWRVAVSWMCSYFTVQIFVPIVFALRGSVDAGQIGMSLSITGAMTLLALAWSTPKATSFGTLIAQRAFRALDQMFWRTLAQSLSVFAGLGIAACALAIALPVLSPRLAARMVSPRMFAVLVAAGAANCIVQTMATLLRSFKSEPFLMQSLAVAACTLGFGAFAASRWGTQGVALSYFGATAGVGLPLAVIIFAHTRQKYMRLVRETVLAGGSQ